MIYHLGDITLHQNNVNISLMADVREMTTGLRLNRSAKGDVRIQVEKLTLQPIYSTFSQTHKVGNNFNANFVFLYI